MRFQLFAFILLIFNVLIAAPVKTVVQGQMQNCSEKWIRVFEYSNPISQKPVMIARDSIGKSGKFKIELMIEKGEIKTVFFAIERFTSFDFFIEGGKSYNIYIDSVDFALQDEYYSPLAATFPNLHVRLQNDPNDLNNLIHQLTMELIRFSVDDFSEVVRLRDFAKFDTLQLRLDSLFSHVKNPFFKTMTEFSVADFQFTARMKRNAWFVTRYFNDRPFQYENPAFMNFFHVFFDKYIYATSRKIPLRDLELRMVYDRNYKALLDSLGKDSLLKNEVVRDMVLIKNTYQMYFAGFFQRDSLFHFMQDISQQSKFPKHKQIATSLLKEMDLHISQRPSPPLIGREVDGNIYNLDSVKGLYTYVFFFTTYCRACYPEFIVMNKLYEKFKNQIYFVSVSMDVNFLKFYYFMQDYQYPWDFVNFFRNFEIEEQWGVKIFPQAMMLNPKGDIINKNAPLPSEHLDSYFNSILKPK